MNRKRRRVRPWVFSVAALAGIGFGVIGGALAAGMALPEVETFLRGGAFRLRVIHWVGLRVLDPAELTPLLGEVTGVALIDLDLNDLSARISRIARVRACSALRLPPDRLILRVEEREPLGRIAGGLEAFDETGKRFPLDPAEDPGLTPVTGDAVAAIPLLLAARERGIDLTEIVVHAPGDLAFRVAGNDVVIRANRDTGRALGDWERVRAAGVLNVYQPREMDLRFEGSAVLREVPHETKGG